MTHLALSAVIFTLRMTGKLVAASLAFAIPLVGMGAIAVGAVHVAFTPLILGASMLGMLACSAVVVEL